MTKHLHQLKLLIAPVLLVLLVFSPLFVFTSTVAASTLEEQLAAIRKELQQIRSKKSGVKESIANAEQLQSVYQGRVGQLRGDVEELQLDITELGLEIEELEIGIGQLEQQILEKAVGLETTEIELDTLDEATFTRINQAYKDYRTHRQNRVDLFNVKDPNTYFKDSQYRELIQDKTNSVMEEIEDLRIQLLRDKVDLEEKQLAIKRSRAIIEDQQSQLEGAEEKLKSKMEGYHSAISVASANINYNSNQLQVYSKQQAKKRAQAELLKQQIFNSFSPSGNGQFVKAGKFIGNQGSTGWSTGPHLHFMVKKNGSTRNPCNFLSSRVSSSEGSCGWGSGLKWPLSGNFYFTSRYYPGGNDSRCFYSNGNWSCSPHQAIDIAHTVWNAPIYAAHDGWLYKGVDQYGALYIILCQNQNCNSGFQTGYWHLSRY